MPAKKPRETHEPETLQEAILVYSDENYAHHYLALQRWPDGEVACPTCGSKAVLYMARYRRWKCGTNHPKRQFSVKVGTIMEDSPLKLGTWLAAIWMVANCKNGVSSYEIHRALRITQKSAWFVLQRIRLAMQSSQGGGKLGGTVEIDETFIGGKARNMHKADRERKGIKPGHGGSNKAMVVGLLKRDAKGHSKVRAAVIPDAKRLTLYDEVYENVEMGSQVMTDEWGPYQTLNHDFEHQFVNHAVEYVRESVVHTNGIENFWSLLKRGLRGTYVSVEPFHLFRYVDEQAFRFNERKDENGDRGRFNTLTSYLTGKRLTYKQLIARDEPSAAAPA